MSPDETPGLMPIPKIQPKKTKGKPITQVRDTLSAVKARGGGPGSKKQVWLISKSNLSWSYYFLQNRKIFVDDENMARQSSGGTTQSHTKYRG